MTNSNRAVVRLAAAAAFLALSGASLTSPAFADEARAAIETVVSSANGSDPLERLAPRRVARWLPSTAGLGLGLFLPLATSLAMLIGAALAAIAGAWRSDAAEHYVWPISAGLLATAAIVLTGSLLRQARPRVDAR